MKHSYLTTVRGHRIAYQATSGEGLAILFCGGYWSDMESSKATAIAQWAAANNTPFIRFDYFAHGKSDGDFKDFTIGAAMADALEILDHVNPASLILVGSSMGGWVALNAALERKGQVRGLIGIASAPDFTERLMVPRMSAEQRQEMAENGVVWVQSDFSDDYPITQHFLTEAKSHLLLDDIIGLDIPVHLLHGQEDADVPWETSLMLAKQIMGDDVAVTLIKDGDHRLNRPADLQLMLDAVARMRGE